MSVAAPGRVEKDLLDQVPILAEIVGRLLTVFDPDRIYLFGSRARGDHHDDSDYDLLVLLPDDAPPEQWERGRAHAALAGMNIAKDVLVNKTSYHTWMLGAVCSLSFTIEEEGHVVYAKNDGV